MPNESKRSWTLEKIEFLISQILDYIDDQKTTIDSALDSSSTNPVQNSAIVTALNNKVAGPSTAVDSQVAIFDGTTGKLIKDSGFTIGTSVPPDAKFSDTNTKVTSVGNHYTPATNAASALTANAANGTAAWSTDVITGITISRDAKGHVTDVSVASGKIPANPNTVFEGGTGTVGRDAGSGNSPRYFPSQWVFNENVDLITGTKILIRIPVAGISYGVFLSMDSGTTFKPIVYAAATRVGTQYAAGIVLELMYDAEGTATIYDLNGGDATITVEGGVWRAMNMYFANTTYSAMSTAEVTAGTASSARTMQARYLSAGLKAAIVKGTNTVPGQFTVYGKAVDTLGATASDNGKFLSVVNGVPTWVSIASASGVSF